ncbi:MAG: family 20 glycosylhydrolase [Ignavibacteriae bacterium]|nr:family 20 glycosylhydrolase [Ignavibacteriota bacterium]
MKKQIIYILLLLFVNSVSAIEIKELKLMPYPKSVNLLDGKFKVDENFNLEVSQNSERLKIYSNKFLMRLANRTGLFLNNPFVNESKNPNAIIDIQRIGLVKLNEDESYELNISDIKIHLKANTDIGAIRGIETLLQLLQIDENGYYFPTCKIIDSPRFPWRGLLIDVSRHFIPIEVLKRNLDGMAAIKLNVMHFHLSDDQGFRVESKTFPKLTELGSDGNFYTHEQIKEILNYANNLGIRVMPEFDVPGHSTALLTAYPELASLPFNYKIERKWGVMDPTLNPTLDKTYDFLDKLFKEMSELFVDEYFHIGGDENNGNQWNANLDIQKFMKENNIPDNSSLQGYFNNKLLKILTKYGKKLVGWDEIFHPSMPNNIVIQSWRGKEALIESAKKGYQTFLSNDYYIDLIQPTDFHYLNDPIPADANLTEEQKKFILGGEATMWAEMISAETIDSRIWPRTAAIAERFWSPQNINDVENMYKRLEYISYLLEEHDLQHIKNFERMLRRLTNNNETESLRNLISVIEPVKFYQRNNLREQTQQTPLTRVIDAATADAKAAREFNQLVENYLSEKNNLELKNKIIQQLNFWKNNHTEFLETAKKSPILFEIIPMSENLCKLSKIGLEVLELSSTKKKMNNELFNSIFEFIQKVKLPVAQTELMIVNSIENLLNIVKE